MAKDVVIEPITSLNNIPISHNSAYFNHNLGATFNLPFTSASTSAPTLTNASKIEHNVLSSSNDDFPFAIYRGKDDSLTTDTVSFKYDKDNNSSFLKRQGWSGHNGHQGYIINQSSNHKMADNSDTSNSNKSDQTNESNSLTKNEAIQSSLASHNLNAKINDLTSSASSSAFGMPSSSLSNHYNYGLSLEDQNRFVYYRNQTRDRKYPSQQNLDDMNESIFGSASNSEEHYENQANQDDFRKNNRKKNSNSLSTSDYDRERAKLFYTHYPKYQPRGHYFAPTAFFDFNDWDTQPEKGWLSSLIGGYKYRNSRYRPRMGILASESIPLAIPASFFTDADGISIIRPTTSRSSWLAYNPKSHTSYLRPYGELYGVAPRLHSMSNFYSYGNLPASSSAVPVAFRHYPPSLIGSSSINYPLKIPYTPFALQPTPLVRIPMPYFRPLITANDLAFAESIRKANTSDTKIKPEADTISYLRPHLSFFHQQGQHIPFIIVDDKLISESSKELPNESSNLIPFGK